MYLLVLLPYDQCGIVYDKLSIADLVLVIQRLGPQLLFVHAYMLHVDSARGVSTPTVTCVHLLHVIHVIHVVTDRYVY